MPKIYPKEDKEKLENKGKEILEALEQDNAELVTRLISSNEVRYRDFSLRNALYLAKLETATRCLEIVGEKLSGR